MPPDTARQQDAALARVERLQTKEDKARKRHELEKGKSDSTLKQMAAKAAKQGKSQDVVDEVQGGKADQKEGTPGRGPIQGGAGLGPHKKNPVGDLSVKEAAKFGAKMASESRKNQLAPNVAGVNEAPQVEVADLGVTDGGKGAEESSNGGAAAAGGGGGGAAAPGTDGSTDAARELTNAPPAEFAELIASTGKRINDEASAEISAKNEAMPEFTATLAGEQPGNADSIPRAMADGSIKRGGEGADAEAPSLKKEARIRVGKGKPGSDIKGAGSDAGADALKELFSASLSKIETQSTANTSPGPAPTVQLSGASSPERGGEEQAQANQKSDEAYVQHVQAIQAGPGPEVVKPLELSETVAPASIELTPIPDVSTPAEAAAYLGKGHDQSVYDKADELQDANFEQALGEAEAQFEVAGDNLDVEHAAKIEEASAAVDAENASAQAAQEEQVGKARADISKGRQDTQKAQEKELLSAKKAGDKQRRDTQKSIEKRRKDDDKKIGKKYKEGEKKAEAKKKQAEKKAEAEKKKAEKKKEDESWWSRAASAVGSFVDSIASAVGSIFDAMAKAVGDILNAVKDAAMGMIDAAIGFATAALDVLGDALKAMVNDLLADVFPGLASALNDLIDSAVNAAKAAVTALGEQLKAAVAAAIDTLNSGIQAVIGAYRAAITTALSIAAAAVSGDWEGALKAMLEGALSLAGIPAAEFYRVVGDGMDTINAIIDDPGSFVGNLISAVGQGFGQFADNFGTHLMDGAVEWLTGSLGEAGITLPDTWDANGIFGLVLDIMGLSMDKLKEKVGERIGEENVALLESAWGYVDAAISGGISGLWEHVQGQLGDLWGGVLDAALSYLTEKIVVAAITKIASMFSPVGAIVQAVLTAWNVYKFVQEQAQRIMGLVTSVVDSMSQIVAGQLGAAAGFIEGSLADLVPVAISLLANLLGLGGVSAKVKEIIEALQEQVDGGVDWALDKLVELGKAAFDAVSGALGGGAEDPEAEAAAAEDAQEQQTEPVGGDPSQLPQIPIASTAGGMTLGWDAERGGVGANAKLVGGPYSGKFAAEGLGKMDAAASSLQGEAKTQADRHLGAARTQVLSVDSRGGKFIRGEELDLTPLRDAFDTLAVAILEGANVLQSANDSGLEGGEFPREARFTDAHGHSHRLWAEADNGAARLMVASTPIRVQEQVAAWNPLVARMVQPDKGQAEALIASAIRIEQEADAIADQIAAGTAEASALDAKQAQLAPVLSQIFSITSANGDFAGLDPRDTLTSSEYMTFEGRFTAFASSVGMSGSQAEAQEIWLATIQKIQQTADSFTQIKKLTPGHYKVELSGKAMQAVVAEFDPIIAALTPLMTAWTTQNKGKKWAFWSGKPASAVAVSAPGWVALESSALGGLFDGLNIDGNWNTQLWGALSNAYAEHLASAVDDAAELGGFVGMYSTGVESIYNSIESKAIVRVLGRSKASKLKWTWYSCVSEAADPNKPDLTQKVDGIPGTFFKSLDRDAAIKEAEDKNRTLHGQGTQPHANLLAHLQANGDASTGFDGSLMSKLETSTAPDDPNQKLPAMEPLLFHQRPTLETLFNRNSNVGKALSDDLASVTVTVRDDGHEEQRGFATDSPYIEPLKQSVKSDLSGTVRSPTIKDSVLKNASPGLPGGAKAAITGWLQRQPSRGTPPVQRTIEDLPDHQYTNAGGEQHELYVEGGSSPTVKQASNNPKEVKKTQHGKAFQLAGQIEELTKRYLGGEDTLDQIKQLLAELKVEMAAARGEIDEAILVKKRLDLEQKLGAHAFSHGASNGAAANLADKSWKLLESLGQEALTKAAAIDSNLLNDQDLATFEPFRELVKKCGMDLGAGFFGSVGKSFDRIRQVFKSGNLREKVQHVVNFSDMWAKQVFKKDADAVAKLLADAGVAEAEIRGVLEERARELAKPADKQKLDKKGLYGSTAGNQEYADAKNSEMDRKFPAVPLETLTRDELFALARRFGMKPRENTSTESVLTELKRRQSESSPMPWIKAGTSGGGESNPQTLSPRGRDTDIGMSGREERAHGLNDAKLPFLEGMLANMVDSNNAWIAEANELEMPLRAGVSGTTHRWMNFAAQLGADLPGSRLAMMGHLIPTNAHSFHEIMTAAQGHVPYSKGKYTPMAPLSDGDLRSLAREAGAEEPEIDAILGIHPNA